MPYVYMEDDPTVLVHYGRLGMKWGQHIFGDDPRWGRNSRGDKKIIKAAEKEKKAEYKNQKKHVKVVSDEDLNASTDRLAREKRYKELVDSEVTPGKAMVQSVLKKIGKETMVGVGYGISSVALKNLAKNFGEEAAAAEAAIKKLDKDSKSYAKNLQTLTDRAGYYKSISEILGVGSAYVKSKTKK